MVIVQSLIEPRGRNVVCEAFHGRVCILKMNQLKLHTMLSAFVLMGVCGAVNTHTCWFRVVLFFNR